MAFVDDVCAREGVDLLCVCVRVWVWICAWRSMKEDSQVYRFIFSSERGSTAGQRAMIRTVSLLLFSNPPPPNMHTKKHTHKHKHTHARTHTLEPGCSPVSFAVFAFLL